MFPLPEDSLHSTIHRRIFCYPQSNVGIRNCRYVRPWPRGRRIWYDPRPAAAALLTTLAPAARALLDPPPFALALLPALLRLNLRGPASLARARPATPPPPARPPGFEPVLCCDSHGVYTHLVLVKGEVFSYFVLLSNDSEQIWTKQNLFQL